MRKTLFQNTMTPRETALLGVYIPIYCIVFPLLMNWHSEHYPGAFTQLQYNVVYLLVSFAVVLLLGLRYLRREFDTLLDRKLLSVITAIQGYFIYIFAGYALVMALLLMFGGVEWENPNNEAIVGMAMGDTMKVLAMSVFLGPVVEEVLFRGVVYAQLRRFGALAGYAGSTLLFALLHVWQYAVWGDGAAALLYMVDYIPVGFVLAWCYERSGSIWTGIFLHLGLNYSALSLLI